MKREKEREMEREIYIREEADFPLGPGMSANHYFRAESLISILKEREK